MILQRRYGKSKKETACKKPSLKWVQPYCLQRKLFYFDFPDSFFALGVLLGEFYFQNAVVIACVNIGRFDVVYTKASGIRAVISFLADIFVFVFLVILFFV